MFSPNGVAILFMGILNVYVEAKESLILPYKTPQKRLFATLIGGNESMLTFKVECLIQII